MLVIGLVLAIGATIHILLRKRNVAAAVGWTGLVWFAPVLGTITYAILGVNRVQRRARKLRPPERSSAGRPRPMAPTNDDSLDALRLGVGRITGRALMAGTTVQAFENGDAGYPQMLEAIAEAKTSVALSSYIFDADTWGGHFIDALVDAKDRGVAVRVLIDGVGGGWLRSPAYHRLRRRGVAADRFLHSLLPWRMPFFNLRSHKKVLVVDGVIGFTGGLNIADDNVMATHPKAPVHDVHFRVEGPVVAQLAENFAEDWNFATDEVLAGETWFPDIPFRDGPLARVIDSGPDADIEKIEFSVLQAVACARTSIAVMTPYLLPDDRLVSALSLAAMRGVSVDLLIPEKSDHIMVDWAVQAHVGPMLSDGVRIWRSPPPFHHTKIMVVDSDWCLFGSCNWDIRSFRLNFELCMEVYDTELAATLAGIMQRSRGRAVTQADIDGRSLPERLRDAAARLLLPYL